MIVTVVGWVYIAIGVLGFFQLAKIHVTNERIVTLVSVAVFLTLGTGLLMRRNWARWLMLGVSLMTWTVGSLLFVLAVVKGFQMYPLSAMPTAVTLAILLFCGLVCVFIWLNFRLFDYLNSEDGRAEFATPESERYAVAKSTAVYVTWWVLSVVVTNSGSTGADRYSGIDMAAVLASHDRMPQQPAVTRRPFDDGGAARLPESQARQVPDENAAREAERATAVAEQREKQAAADAIRVQAQRDQERIRERAVRESVANAQEDLHRKTRELFERRIRDHSYTDAQFAADQERLQREFGRAIDALNSNSATAHQPSAPGEHTSSAILKCRDASGAISFTQNYCPYGSTLVQSPPAD
jgi:hypothetical protein